jgi:archaellum component FlaC
LDTKTSDDENGRPLHQFLERRIGKGLSDDVKVLIVYDGVQNKFRDMADIVQAHGKGTIAASAKMEQFANEIEDIQRQIEELVSSALPVPGHIHEQRQEKMKLYQEEIEKMEFAQASFEYAMGKLNRVLRVRGLRRR